MRALILALALLATPAGAVQPDEILADPALESRARSISQGLRCLVCQNENIDDSQAGLARDLRVLLRERLVAGDTDEQAVAYIVDRYGEFVLLRPTTGGANLILWLAGPALLLAGIGVAALTLRRSARATGRDAPLSEADRARLAEILSE